MYLYHFGFKKLPFSLTPDTELFCALSPYKQAMNTLRFALVSGEAFCKITGEVGSGKTMICRLLINKIKDQRTVAYIPNPVLSSMELKMALAHELNLRMNANTGGEMIIPKIQKKLIQEYEKKGPVILIIDEAQAMSDDTLETLRLFTNLETEQFKLLQIVLLGQPELNRKLAQKHMRQLRQRITFSHNIRALTSAEVSYYIKHRLQVVSTEPKIVFSRSALCWVYRLSRGTPRLVNVLCHKALMLSYGKNSQLVYCWQIFQAARDTEDTRNAILRWIKWSALIMVGLTSTTAVAWWMLP